MLGCFRLYYSIYSRIFILLGLGYFFMLDCFVGLGVLVFLFEGGIGVRGVFVMSNVVLEKIFKRDCGLVVIQTYEHF